MSSKLKRSILSFFLFISIFVCSFSSCALGVFYNSDTYINLFTSDSYLADLHKDIDEYGRDMCKRVSLPEDTLSKSVRYSNIAELQKAYANNSLGDYDVYNQFAYSTLLEQLSYDIAESVNNVIKDNGIRIDSKQGVDEFTKRVVSYVQKRIEFSYTNELVNAISSGKRVCKTLIVLSALACIGLIVLIYKTSDNAYRKLRDIAVAIESTSLLYFVMFLSIAIVEMTKKLVIYPSYLAQAFMRYVDSVMTDMAMISVAFMMAAFLLMSVIWCQKHAERD